jgi:N6-L-threonylcarbamoyladenine synthase
MQSNLILAHRRQNYLIYSEYILVSENKIYILAIESSCDDTGAAIICDGRVVSNVTASQQEHSKYGGVIPELASRQHMTAILPVVASALQEAGIEKQQLNGIAFTRGPGLLGSLLVGVSVAKSMSLVLDLPMVDVHHMQAHIMAHFASEPFPAFPFLCLTVSGGHTQFVKVNSFIDMEILGQTLDDAVGEAFDKVGKMLNLPYPAGPVIDQLADQGSPVFSFPEPQVKGFDVSFSGFKTAVLYFLQAEMAKNPQFIETNLADICCSVRKTLIHYLIKKLRTVALATGISHIGIAGGVSANRFLRDELTRVGKEEGWQTYIPPFALCTDNAGMIGIAGYYKFMEGHFCEQDVVPSARMEW